jgi:hypothetical protein
LRTSFVEFVCFANSTHSTTHCKVALVLQIPYLCSSFFASFFPLPSFHFWLVFNPCFVIVGDVVEMLLHPDEFGDYFFTVGALLLYRMCTGCMVW